MHGCGSLQWPPLVSAQERVLGQDGRVRASSAPTTSRRLLTQNLQHHVQSPNKMNGEMKVPNTNAEARGSGSGPHQMRQGIP